jgi:ABC-type transporter Mla MlaB component
VHTFLSLPAELTIYTVAALQPEGLVALGGSADGAAAAGPAPARVAADRVAEIDAAGLQLLLSLSNALARRHRRLHLVDPSRALVAACAALGVTSLLGDADSEGSPA